MIKYYAYYNHGGYKDFYIGSIQDKDEAKYFLPLLAIHEQTLIDNPNDELMKEVRRQEQLPKLVVLSDNTDAYNYPNSARVLMSHSGYKVIYRQLDKNNYVLAIRDISGSIDCFGRKTPYNIMIIGENDKDRMMLDILAEFVRLNLLEFEKFLDTIFENDLSENGLKVHMSRLNSRIKQIILDNKPLIIDDSLSKSVRMIIIPSGMELSNCLKEQNVSKYSIYVCYNTEGALIYKAVKPQLDNSNDLHQTVRSKEPSQNSLKGHDEHFNPSLHAMLNVPKREDILKLWDYIYKLEERIEQLENFK